MLSATEPLNSRGSWGTIPICLSELHINKKVAKGDYVVLSSFGAGYTWGSVLIRWAIDT
jgi:3-oxoacyl-[acyl-carrier-protein] synthase III